MAFDPYLYLALAVGVLAGWLVRPTSPWVGRATMATVVVLVGLLGASLTSIPASSLLLTIPIALAFTLLVLAATTAVFWLLVKARPLPPPRVPGVPSAEKVPFSVWLLIALVAGYGIGLVVAIPTAEGISIALYALLGLVGFGLHLSWGRLPSLWVPVTAAVVGAFVAGALFAVVSGVALSVSLAITMGFAFYSLAGPLVLARAGAVLGLLAFLTNFLRENLTMLLAPRVGRRLRGEGLAAWGGASSMDTTLYFVIRYGDADAGSLAIANGLVLTIAASLLLPLLLAFPV